MKIRLRTLWLVSVLTPFLFVPFGRGGAAKG